MQVSDPKDVEHMLTTNMNNYIKSGHYIQSLGEVFGKTLIDTNHSHVADGGAMYRLQRNVVTRVFTTSNFKDFTEGVFRDYALRIIDIINAQDGKVDMYLIASQFTLQTIFDIGCGVSLESFDKELGVKFVKSMNFIFETFIVRIVTKPYFKYLSSFMPNEYRFQRESKFMMDLVDSILQVVAGRERRGDCAPVRHPLALHQEGPRAQGGRCFDPRCPNAARDFDGDALP